MDAQRDFQEQAYRYIKEQIVNLQFKPGTPLRTQLIADSIRVSRTPVREALSKLEKERLVARNGGWGYVVRALTVKEAMDLYRVREILEVEAVREIIPAINKEFVQQLRGHLRAAEAMVRDGKFDGFRRSTRAFYRAIAERTGNAYLQFMLRLIEDQIRLLGAMMAVQHMERPRVSLAENRAVLRALEARDAEAAAKAVRNHVGSARETLLKHVREQTHTISL